MRRLDLSFMPFWKVLVCSSVSCILFKSDEGQAAYERRAVLAGSTGYYTHAENKEREIIAECGQSTWKGAGGRLTYVQLGLLVVLTGSSEHGDDAQKKASIRL